MKTAYTVSVGPITPRVPRITHWLTQNRANVASAEQSPEALVALASILVDDQSLEAALAYVLDLACSSMAGGDMGSVTLLDRQGPTTPVTTEDDARGLDLIQYQSDAGGPCLDAYRRQQVYRIDCTMTDQRWPEFSAAAAGAGIFSTLSLPLVVAGDGLGALNIYCRRADGFTAQDEAAGKLFAAHASVALANARTFWKVQSLAVNLSQALSTRGVIEQAKGILMAAHGCSADAAFDMLVRSSQNTHTKLHDVAAQLVERARSEAPRAEGAAFTTPAGWEARPPRVRREPSSAPTQGRPR